MSTTAIILVCVAATAALAAVAIWVVARHTSLPRHPWAKLAGARFAADLEERRSAVSEALTTCQRLMERSESAVTALAAFEKGPAEAEAELAISKLVALPRELDEFLVRRERALETLTVVLYGRTKAGKSTLFHALTGVGEDGIGDGRQNVTEDRLQTALKGVELVDTPGISGVGSERLEQGTVEALREADVVLVEITEDRLSQEDFERIDELAWPPRPIIVALNVKAGDLDELVERPHLVFRSDDLQPHMDRLVGGLPSLAHRDLPIVPCHALAASEARRNRWSFARQALWEGSRITALQDALGAVGLEATAAARRLPAAMVVRTAETLQAVLEQCAETARDSREAEDRALKQVEGILEEARARRAIAKNAIKDHFDAAELELLEALDEVDRAAYRKKAQKALGADALEGQLRDLLEDARAEVADKLKDLEEELEVLDVDFNHDVSTFDNLWDARNRLRSKASDARRTNKRRRREKVLLEAAGIAVGALVGGVLGGLGGAAAGGAAGGEIGSKVGEKYLVEIEVPEVDGAVDVRRLRTRINALRSGGFKAFEHALSNGLIEPVKEGLIEPRRTDMETLEAFAVTAEYHAHSLGETPFGKE